MNIFSQRINKLLKKMSEENLDVAVITDEDNVYYFSGYIWNLEDLPYFSFHKRKELYL